MKFWKAIATGDEHCSERSRFAEYQRIYGDYLLDVVQREKPNLVLRGGDIYESSSTPRERLLVAEQHTAVAEFCAEVIVKGNHDPALDLPMLSLLRTRHKIHVIEDADVVYEAGAGVACIAWPKMAEFLSRIPADVPHQETAARAQLELSNILRGLGMKLAKHKGPRIGLGHLFLKGVEVGAHQKLLVGGDFSLSLAEVALLKADIVVISHIHKAQEFASPLDNSPILYTGSGFRTAWGEVEEKSFLLCVFNEQGRLDHWERIPTPATAMVLLETRYQPDGSFLYLNDVPFIPGVNFEVKGADIRFRYHVDAEHRVAADINGEKTKALLLRMGAVSVKVEEQLIAHTRARMPGIVTAVGLTGKIEHYWREIGNEPQGAFRAGVLAKARKLEEQALALAATEA